MKTNKNQKDVQTNGNNAKPASNAGGVNSAAANRSSIITRAVLVALAVLFLLVGVFSTQLFGEDSDFALVMKENVGDVVSVFSDISGRGPAILRAITLVIVVLLAAFLLKLVLKALFMKKQKTKTLITLTCHFIQYLSVIIIAFAVLSAFGVDTSTLLASAGILALIIGLGAQSLVADILAGISIVFESKYKMDDTVIIDGFRGKITDIGVTNTKIMDSSGNIKIINNSAVGTVINMSNELSLAVCEVSIEYGESIERVENIINDNLDSIKARIPAICDGPYYKGVSLLADSGVILKFIAKVREEDRYQTERDLNREIKIIFDKNNVNIPFPQVVINQPQEFAKVNQRTRAKANEFVDEQKELSQNLEDAENK